MGSFESCLSRRAEILRENQAVASWPWPFPCDTGRVPYQELPGLREGQPGPSWRSGPHWGHTGPHREDVQNRGGEFGGEESPGLESRLGLDLDIDGHPGSLG